MSVSNDFVPQQPTVTFAGFAYKDLDAVAPGNVVVLSASEGSPYANQRISHSANAPSALRTSSQSFAKQLTQFDFDLGRALLDERGPKRFFDGGEIPTEASDGRGNRKRIQDATAAVLQRGGKTIMLGGDDSVPIPWLAAHQMGGSYVVLQIDAHTDWADEIQGNRFGYGSPMRRASEMAWISGMVQVGARGLGSGGAWQIDDARAWGSQIITMPDIRTRGISAALEKVPQDSRVLISLDCDGLDPAAFPAVNMPTPGGLTYADLVELFRGVAAKAEIAGAAILEYVPERDDANKQSALMAARLVTVLMGLMVR